ncbi:MAG: dienelactone hydrolase family protein [Burkholderiaceae bacterium]
MSQWIELTAADGHRFKAWEAKPSGTPRGALIVAPEIFGINSHIRAVADGYAADGYLTVAPALFDRARRDFETGYEQADIDAGIAVMQKLDNENALLDLQAVAEHLRPAGKLGIVGYCWGGTLAWLSAARLPGLSAAIAYYGGGIPGLIGLKPACPTICHFGERDTHPSLEQAKAVAAAHPEVVSHFYAAGHGFNCDQRGSYDAEAARLARTRTLAHLAAHVG